eukprot:11303245-Alexandrium_andersonii.AAC.1
MCIRDSEWQVLRTTARAVALSAGSLARCKNLRREERSGRQRKSEAAAGLVLEHQSANPPRKAGRCV